MSQIMVVRRFAFYRKNNKNLDLHQTKNTTPNPQVKEWNWYIKHGVMMEREISFVGDEHVSFPPFWQTPNRTGLKLFDSW